MQRPTQRVLLLMLCATALSLALFAQTGPAPTGKTITIRVLDAKTAHPVIPTNFLVRINHQQTIHANWVTQNENRSATLTVPADATVVSIQVTYDSAMETFISCDSFKDKQDPQAQWYPVSKIFTSGIVAHNYCSKMIETAHPGEFIFFVRKANFRERTQEDF
jgi:hypothetical protein